MKKLIFFLFISVSILYSCKSQMEKDYEIIENYLNENNIEAQKHTSGIYYVIHQEGEGANPTIYDLVEVKYVGKLIDETIFDQTSEEDTVEFRLYGTILGWQYGIPLIKKGGKETLYIPSELGYGNKSVGSIPANSVLIFDVELKNIKP